MKKISASQMLKQLKADLIGKDSHRGITLTYAWLANQWGHFSLGFIPTLVVYFVFDPSALVAALIVSGFWLFFESYNLLMTLYSKKTSNSPVLFIPVGECSFAPARRNIVFDTITDLGYFWLGTTSAILPVDFSRTLLYVVIGIFVALFYPFIYWYRTKMYLQHAQYPFQFRLSQFDLPVSDKNKNKIEAFLNTETGSKHLFVFGSKKTGKTSLSVGIATERSIRHETCVYTTGMKLFSMFFESEANLAQRSDQLWTWRTSSLLIIDDINPGAPVKDLVSPEKFLSLLTDPRAENGDNKKVIQDKRVIWVLGEVDFDDFYVKTWQDMLERIGVEEKDILLVDLQT